MDIRSAREGNFPAGEHVGHMKEAFDAGLKFHESAILPNVDHPPLEVTAN